MIQQIAVYDESGAQVGMTFPKRAKQLVGKQRAIWHDDEHTAIFLLPEVKTEDALDDESVDAEHDAPKDAEPAYKESDDLLLYLAKKNVKEKKRLIWLIVAYIIAMPLVYAFYVNNVRASLHPQYRSIMSITDFADETIPMLIETFMLEDAVSVLHAIAVTYTPPGWYFVRGLWTAWTVWIVVGIARQAAKHFWLQRKKAGRDPVNEEYQRLKGMVSDGVAVARF